jgi:pimeloyl-ACP methyl ester carboxylesterase
MISVRVNHPTRTRTKIWLIPPLSSVVRQTSDVQSTRISRVWNGGIATGRLNRRPRAAPAGLAAWIVEKLRAWSDCDGDVERSFTKDEILTNVTLYWLTGTIGSSMRMYHANAKIPAAQHARRVEVPSGFALFPGDIVRPPRAWLDRTANVVRVTEPARGGHFAPFEEPELYAEELRAFFRPYRAAAATG